MAKNTQLIYLLLLFIAGCAIQIPPPGGEIDREAPEITETYPVNGTTRYSENYISLTFSEYVEKNSVRESVFISPEIEGELEYSWSGTRLEIEFNDSLKENTTYTFTIGTNVSDVNARNKMRSAYVLVFSTGDEIDNCVISGKIYDDEPEGIMLFAYRENEGFANPLEEKADYRSQSGADGSYHFMGLSEGNYRVFAVRDEFGDFLYGRGEDNYGAPFREVILTETDTLFSGLNFKMTMEDTLVPNLVNVAMTDRNHLVVEFSEPVDSSLFDRNSIFLYDSTAGRKIGIKHIFRGQLQTGSQFFTFSDSLSEENEYFLHCGIITDYAGNSAESEPFKVALNSAPDTTALMVARIIATPSQNAIDFIHPELRLIFNDSFDFGDESFVSMQMEGGGDIPLEIIPVDDAALEIIPRNTLKENTAYSLAIDFSLLTDVAGNRADSVHIIQLKTIGKQEFTGVSGKLFNFPDSANVIVLSSLTEKRDYKIKIKKDGSYDFPRVYPGKFFLWSFSDRNNNDEYDYGSVSPFIPSEQFIYYSDTLDLKPRWPVTDLFLDYKSQ